MLSLLCLRDGETVLGISDDLIRFETFSPWQKPSLLLTMLLCYYYLFSSLFHCESIRGSSKERGWICVWLVCTYADLQGWTRLQLIQFLVRALCLDCRQLPSHCVLTWLVLCVCVHRCVFVQGGVGGKRESGWVGIGEREVGWGALWYLFS